MTRPKQTAGAGKNWSGTLSYSAAHFYQPRSVDELQAVVKEATRVRALGTRHTFNAIGDTSGDLVSLEHLNRILELDEKNQTVTVEGGVRYADLGPWLYARGYALHNLASFPQLSVAGAVATGTHGSGSRHQSLAAGVSALQLVAANGEMRSFARVQHGDHFDGMVVSLGATGIVTALTLAVEPSYDVRQDVYENLALTEVLPHFDEVMAGADSVSLFTNYQGGRFHTAWLKRRMDAGQPYSPTPSWFGASLAERAHHPVLGGPAERCTVQLGVPGPWFERWPHFQDGQTPSTGHELQSEYLLPRVHAGAALEALFDLGERLNPLLLVGEVRTVAADDLWLSPAYLQDSVALHFTWQPDETAVAMMTREIEEALAPFKARPHWGKVFTTAPTLLGTLFPRLPDFRRLCLELDPLGKFRNAFLDRMIFTD